LTILGVDVDVIFPIFLFNFIVEPYCRFTSNIDRKCISVLDEKVVRSKTQILTNASRVDLSATANVAFNFSTSFNCSTFNFSTADVFDLINF